MTGARAITAAMCAHATGLAEPRLAPTGHHLAWLATTGGRTALVVRAVDGGPSETVSADPAPISVPAYGGGAFDWLPDGSALVYAARDGDLWHVPLRGGPSRRLTAHGPAARAAAPAVAPSGDRVAYVVDQRDVAVVGLDGAWPVKLSHGADFALDPHWTADGQIVWHEWDVPAMPWDESRLVRAAPTGGGPLDIVHAPPGGAVQQPRPAPQGGALACVSDEWGWANLTVLDRPSTGPYRVVPECHEHASASWGHGQRSITWSPDARHLAYCRNENGFGRLCVVELASGAVREVAKGVHGNLTWAGGHLGALRSGARTPAQVVVYDTTSWEREVVAVGPVAGFEAADLPEPEPLTARAPDGATLHARWYPPLATAAPPGPAPTIVWVHGGPTDQWAVTFRSRIALFAARGWGVLVPDHRGSTGHGRAYMQALRGRWGELDVADCATLTDAAVTSGRAAGRRLVAMGASAGGFTVLNLLAHEPQRWAAGVVLYPVTDLLDLAERTHRFEAHYTDSLVGPLPAAVARYRERSPITRVERITAPLLVLHGTADEVVPVQQTDALVDRLRAHGSTVEHHRYEGEGHGWGKPDTVMDELARVEGFIERYGRRWRAME